MSITSYKSLSSFLATKHSIKENPWPKVVNVNTKETPTIKEFIIVSNGDSQEEVISSTKLTKDEQDQMTELLRRTKRFSHG